MPTCRRLACGARVARSPGSHAPGSRVKIVRDPEWNASWPAEPEGLMEPGCDCPARVVDLSAHSFKGDGEDRGLMRTFMVRFATPRNDGENKGPYYMAEIWKKYLGRHPELVSRESVRS